MTNPLTKNEWSMLLRVLEHGEVLHPADAARLAAKIREAQEPKKRPARDDGQSNWEKGDRAAPASLMRRFAV